MAHSHVHRHDAVPAHGVGGGHRHAPESPHPAEVPPWSMLRLSLPARLALAAGLSAALWGMVWLAMRPS
ncbi:MAG: hypothetical protein WBA29_10740 [Xanthobacteraceae bacterium]